MYYKGNQQGVLGIWETTQREPSTYSVNNYVISCAYLCTAAVCSSFAWGHTVRLYPEVQDWILQGAARPHWDRRDVKQMPADFAEQRAENWTGGKREPPAVRKQPSSLRLPVVRHSEVAGFTPAALFQSLFALPCSMSRQYTQVCPQTWCCSVANWSWLRDLQAVICRAPVLSVCWACPLITDNKMQASLLNYFTVFLLFYTTKDSTAVQAGRQVIHLPPQRQQMPSPSPVWTGQYHLALLRKPTCMRKGRWREAHRLMRTLPFLRSCKCI